MDGEIRSIGRQRSDADDVGDVAVFPFDTDISEREPARVRSWLSVVPAIVVALLAAAWLGLTFWQRSGSQISSTVIMALTIIREASPPLALLALIYLLIVRTSRSEATRFTRISGGLRAERGRLEASLASTALRIEHERTAIGEQSHALMTIGDEAAARLQAIGEKLRSDLEGTARQAEGLKNAAASARRDMTALLGDVPQAHAQTLEMTRTLEAAGLAALERAGALDAEVAALVVRAREADEVAGGAAQKLAAHLARVEGVSESAGGHLVGAAETMTSAIDAALGRAAAAADAARQGMEAQGAAMLALVEQGEAAMARTGAKTAEAVSARVGNVTATIAALGGLLGDQEAAIARQRMALDSLSNEIGGTLTRVKATVSDLVSTVEEADARTREIAGGAGATLVESMVRVREAAQVASDRAREALAAIVPESAERLGNAARTALSQAVRDGVEVHIGKLADTAGQAVSAANAASDRLMRQMLTIAETSAQVEARIGEARGEIDEADRDSFARRVALLIESLNSTAIDVTKILSNEVTDGAWSAYLKGDRGVFTRRAVRLLDASDLREVTRHYNDDPEFREQVNRYVHDFEAMLRNVLATRAGSPLGVTLLSSDMGKLYVALAQAIDRLRS